MNSNWKLLPAALLVAVLALAGCGGGSDEPTGPTDEERAAMEAAEALKAMQDMQRMAITDAVDAAGTAVNAVNNTAADSIVKAADDAIAAAKAALAAATDLPDGDDVVATAEGALDALETQLATAKTARTMAMAEADRLAQEEADRMAEEARKAAEAAAAAMAVTASKLYSGIGAPTDTTSADTRRNAAYGSGENADDIAVLSREATAAVNLTEDEDAVVAALHGWEGMRFTAEPADDGMYEAVVYSHIGEPTEGPKFNAGTSEGAYDLTDGATAVDTSTAEVQARVVLPGVTRTAGTETFMLPDPNPGNQQVINVPGSFHGVSGTYRCDTGTSRTDACSASVAENGFTLTGTWTFAPTDPEARLMDVPDPIYASYGWWIHKSEDGEVFTASAFTANKGAVPAATGVTALMGTATYSGGAVGKYALHSTTGGTNDAGHFTADATLEADFNADMITGTIDNFTGADGQSRNWSVELMESGVGDGGIILGADGTGTPMMTKWTLDGTAADAAGQWQGNLHENGDDGVPGIATGTFYSEYGRDGKMVGAFGANVE